MKKKNVKATRAKRAQMRMARSGKKLMTSGSEKLDFHSTL